MTTKNSSNSQLALTSDLLPASDAEINLGSSTNPFNSLYLANSGGTVSSPLSFYEEYQTTGSFTCLQGTPVLVPLYFTRCGRMISLNIPAFNITSSTGTVNQNVIITPNNTVPNWLLPANGSLEIVGYCRIQINGVDTFGFLMISGYGSIQYYMNASISNYPVNTLISVTQAINATYQYNI